MATFIVSELYYPEESATAHYMTCIAEDLAGHSPVQAVCARPKYDLRWSSLPPRDIHNGVEIRRCWSTTFDKNRLLGRMVNVVTTCLSMFLVLLRRVRKDDDVLVVTNPPMLPFVVLAACRLRGARCCLRIDDVYPEAMIHAGLIKPHGLVATLVNWMNCRLFRRMQRIIVLGRDMQRLVEQKLGSRSEKVVVIPNWADLDSVVPGERRKNKLLHEYGLQDKFVIGYAGNIGRVQGIEVLFEAARLLKDVPDVHFVFVGSGQKVTWLKRAVAEARLENITLPGPRPRADQADFLNGCDIGIISLVRGMSGAGVPSRLYNVMAAGKPVIAAVDADSEPALVVNEESIGWVVPPDQPDKIVAAILDAKSNRQRLGDMGTRARQAAEKKYSRERVIKAYENLIGGRRNEMSKAGTVSSGTR
jgi:glycosyltransferase involved in cell wall biosynthesis